MYIPVEMMVQGHVGDDNVTGQENILVKMTIPIPTPKSKRVARAPITKASKTKAEWLTKAPIKIAIYCPQGSGTLRQQLLMMH